MWAEVQQSLTTEQASVLSEIPLPMLQAYLEQRLKQELLFVARELQPYYIGGYRVSSQSKQSTQHWRVHDYNIVYEGEVIELHNGRVRVRNIQCAELSTAEAELLQFFLNIPETVLSTTQLAEFAPVYADRAYCAEVVRSSNAKWRAVCKELNHYVNCSEVLQLCLVAEDTYQLQAIDLE